ncbi:hypothetical protein COLO4_36660 [Corchorus olitorius]|uniref:Uncharacterized protein n=1 Tax=Corchorus olitorius TaxID=93759 RepID=A0A1R3G750_9ROSI|nr:hypothetical protein COLO4_36660 [Corchorus olitorius]
MLPDSTTVPHDVSRLGVTNTTSVLSTKVTDIAEVGVDFQAPTKIDNQHGSISKVHQAGTNFFSDYVPNSFSASSEHNVGRMQYDGASSITGLFNSLQNSGTIHHDGASTSTHFSDADGLENVFKEYDGSFTSMSLHNSLNTRDYACGASTAVAGVFNARDGYELFLSTNNASRHGPVAAMDSAILLRKTVHFFNGRLAGAYNVSNGIEGNGPSLSTRSISLREPEPPWFRA